MIYVFWNILYVFPGVQGRAFNRYRSEKKLLNSSVISVRPQYVASVQSDPRPGVCWSKNKSTQNYTLCTQTVTGRKGPSTLY